MSYRTIIILDGDMEDEWSNDTELGRKIAAGAKNIGGVESNLAYGHVVASAAAHLPTVIALNGTSAAPVVDEAALRSLAKTMGFNVSRISLKENMGWTSSSNIAN